MFKKFVHQFDRLVKPFPPEEVTSREGSAEVAAEEGGVTPQDVEAMWSAVEDLYAERLNPAISLCVRRQGAVILDRTIGHLRGNAPDDPPDAELVQATPQSLFNIFSASKAVTAMVIHWLDEHRLLHLDDPVAEVLPEFGQKGKSGITLRHLLTHRAGIPQLPAEYVDLELLTQPDRIVEVICALRPSSPAGRRLAYHALTSGWIQAEVVKRVTGRTIGEVLREEFLDPLGIVGMDYGTSLDKIDQVAQHALTGPPILPPFSGLLKRGLGVSFGEAVEFSNDPRFLTATVPAGNILGTAEEVSRFFEMLRCGGELDGTRVLERRTVQRATAEQEYLSVDATFGVPVRYSMGFMLGSRVASIFGPDTEEVFGHLGFTTVMVWADPARQVSACLMTSGKHFVTPGLWSHYKVMRAIRNSCPRSASLK